MKTILSSRRDHHLVKVCVFLITAALIAGMAGCAPVQYNLTISSTEGGSVTDPGERTFTYDSGTVVDLVATPDAGYHFVEWTGDVDTISDVENSTTTITMHGSYAIIANFAIEVWDWYDLDTVRDNLSGNYLLMNHLDSATAGYEELASPTANGGKGWQPIGTIVKPFTGTLNGQGYEIRDLFITRPDESSVGLFGFVDEGGRIEDIGVVKVAVNGDACVGSLVGSNGHGTVSNTYSTGSVTGNQSVGGLVGLNQYASGVVSNSYSSANVTGYATIGGLIGQNGYGTVSNSYATGSVTGDVEIGGLVGHIYYAGTVSNSYSTGNVTGEDCVGGLTGGNWGIMSNSYSTSNVTGYTRIGGLVGWNEGGTVSNSYSTGSATGNSSVGGLVGLNGYDGTVSNSYSTGSVSGNEDVGGLVGLNDESTVSDSFWDIQTSGQADSDGGIGQNTEQMKNINTFSGAGWNITTVALNETNPAYIWNIINGVTYPFLSWQPV
jgi:hypothetical protein